MEQQLNKMCLDCPHLDSLCDGTHNDIYSGCIWKTADAESLETFRKQVDEITSGKTPQDGYCSDPAK